MVLLPLGLTTLALAFGCVQPASAQCCRKICPQPAYQNPRPQTIITVARGTRQETKAPTGEANWNVAGARPVHYNGLDLKIISGTADRRLATVNNQTFRPGETLKVTVRDTSLLVRCLEIRERSALVKVHGEDQPRELKLQQSWQQ